jgi:hypothetical protein
MKRKSTGVEHQQKQSSRLHRAASKWRSAVWQTSSYSHVFHCQMSMSNLKSAFLETSATCMQDTYTDCQQHLFTLTSLCYWNLVFLQRARKLWQTCVCRHSNSRPTGAHLAHETCHPVMYRVHNVVGLMCVRKQKKINASYYVGLEKTGRCSKCPASWHNKYMNRILCWTQSLTNSSHVLST